jgi:murein DD-endopeptidase MepM/ murein hydrolase activator NlpD
MRQNNEERRSEPKPSRRFALEYSLGSRHMRTEFTTRALAGYAASAMLLGLIGPYSVYFAFRGDLLSDLGDRQTELRYLYEDRLAALRMRLDQATSRQFVDQDDVESKLRALVVRQAKLETRAAVVARIVEDVAGPELMASATSVREPKRKTAALPAPALAPMAASRAAYAPLVDERPAAFAAASPAKPEPEGMELRLRIGDESSHPSAGLTVAPRNAPAERAEADTGAPVRERLDRLAVSMDRVERDQTVKLARIVEPVRAAGAKLRHAFDAAGLPTERYIGKPARGAAFVGGPYVAADQKPSDLLFERQLSAAQEAASTLASLRRALPAAPLRKPLSGPVETTSTFGYRTDPFFGRPALHTGVDLRDEYGSPVRATAAGVVVTAGHSGGYGQMVEIDHGSGVATRYAHLSSISASVGQEVEPGAVLGRLGSTGRSTGPHLHYEVRIDGEPVDPARFLRAAASLAEGK